MGYSSPSVPDGPPRAGSFVPAFWDRGVVRVPSELFALAQLDGTVASGPASGLSDPVVLRLGQQVDLGSGFIVEVAGRSLFSAGAADPAGHTVGSGFRYWMWDAPCAHWQTGDSAEMRLIKLEADDSRQGAHTDTKLTALDVHGAVLDAVFDPAVSTHAASAAASTAQVTVDAAANAHACDVNIAPDDADPDTEGHQVDLGAAGTDTTVTVTVTAADNTTTAQHTLTIARGATAKASSLTLSGTEGLGFEPGKRRYDTTPAAGSTSTTVAMAPVGDAVLEGFAVTAGDTEVAAIGDDGTVSLTAGKDTLVAVRAATADNESQTVYTVRLRGTQQSQSDQGQGAQNDQGQGARDSQGIQGSLGQGVGRSSFSASGAVAKSIHATGGAPDVWTRYVADPVVPRTAPAGTAPAGTEPRLTALDVTPGALTPAFDSATHAYDIAVAHDTEHITVTPTASSAADALIDLPDADPDTDGHQVALNAAGSGAKPAQTAALITVTDGTAIDSYTLTVTRDAPPPRIGTRQDMNAPRLASLVISDIALAPAFAAGVFNYTASVTHDTGHVTVTATADGTATAAIDLPDADADTQGHQIELDTPRSNGRASLTAVVATVTSTNSTTQTYTVNITRAALSVPEPSGTDFPADATTLGRLAIDDYVTGNIDDSNDVDWYAVELEANVRYNFYSMGGDSPGELTNASITGINTADGPIPDTRNSPPRNYCIHGTHLYWWGNYAYCGVTSDDDYGFWYRRGSMLDYEPSISGTYYIGVTTERNNASGAYNLIARNVSRDLVSYMTQYYGCGDNLCGQLEVGVPKSGFIDWPHFWRYTPSLLRADSDYFEIELTAGRRYHFSVTDGKDATGTAPLFRLANQSPWVIQRVFLVTDPLPPQWWMNGPAYDHPIPHPRDTDHYYDRRWHPSNPKTFRAPHTGTYRFRIGESYFSTRCTPLGCFEWNAWGGYIITVTDTTDD